MKNRLLKALPQKEFRTLASEVFFPEEAIISCLSGTADGATLEVCVIGNEGVAGIDSVLGESTAFRVVVQLPGRAYSIEHDVLRWEFKRCDGLHRVLLHYTNALLVQIAQTAVCNKFHSIEKRFCRWLVMAHDRSASDELPLTQEALARVLASRRASVSVTASAFQKKGAIRYSRGVIRILDRKHLESASCECYETISAAHSKIND